MGRRYWVVLAVLTAFGCSGKGGGSGADAGDGAGEARGEATAEVGPGEVADRVAPEDVSPEVPRVDVGTPDEGGPDKGGDAGADAGGDAAADGELAGDTTTEAVQVPEEFADAATPACDQCYVLSVETWDGAAELVFPTKGEYVQEAEGLTFIFRPWMRFRMPHPGKVKRLYVMASGAGALEMRLSTGFPGGHYPCLDENTGEDLYAAGPPFVMETTADPGWRVFDVSEAGHQVGGYDEFFVIFRQQGEARVGLSYPMPVEPGDYGIYGGLIADAPGDGLSCFPSMTNFGDAMEQPLLWVVRAEIEADVVVEDKWFEDGGPAGLNIGGHASFGDYDNDGDDDLLSGGTLWENDSAGSFEDVSAGAGLTGLGGETVWGDYDNDGDRDILGIGGKAILFRNNGDGTFTDVTAESGIFIDASSQGVVWFDLDADGFLDFYAASYGTLADSEIPEHDYLFVNNTDGTFTDFTEQAGIPLMIKKYHGRGVCAADYDEDRDQDVYVGNYRLDPNFLWQNQGGLTGVKDVAKEANVKGIFEFGGYGHTIGPSFGDLNGDGLFDLVVPNLAHPRFMEFSDATMLHFNQGDGTFDANEAPTHGILYDETHSDSVLFDPDNDGDLDLFLTAVYEGRRSYLYENNAAGDFTDSTYLAGIRHFGGWGAAAADVDGDGDPDLVANRLFRNVRETGNHYLNVRLTGAAGQAPGQGSNRDAIGAVVVAKAGASTILRQVEGGKGVGCQNSAVLHFGLGPAAKVDTLTVLWPSGKTETIEDVSADQVLEIEE